MVDTVTTIFCYIISNIIYAVEKYNIPRDYLHVEITESMIVQDEDLMLDIISKFRARGYEIWMDVFIALMNVWFNLVSLWSAFQMSLTPIGFRALKGLKEISVIF